MKFHVVWQLTDVHQWHPHSSFSFLLCRIFELSEQDTSYVISAVALQLRQNNNIPATCDGQPRWGGDSVVVSGHRLKVERWKQTLTFPSEVCSQWHLSCQETLRPPPAIKHLRPQNVSSRSRSWLQPNVTHLKLCQKRHFMFVHCDLLNQRVSFPL